MYWGRCLVLLVTILLVVTVTVTVVTYLGWEDVGVEGNQFDLEADFAFKYFDLLEEELVRNVSDFPARRSLLDSVCRKYKDPFRPESRGLFHTKPPLNHFSFFQYRGQSVASCTILKAGSNSWKTFLKLLEGELGSLPEVPLDKTATLPSESCWPDCAQDSLNIMQVRHPLERLLSAWRYVFQKRNAAYEDQFDSVRKVKQEQGTHFRGLGWPQFVDMLIKNQLTKHSENKQDINEPDVWVANHWAPYWFTCGLCLPPLRPTYIMHLDKMDKEVPFLMHQLGISGLNLTYPRVLQGNGGTSEMFLEQFYSQLTKAEVWQLFLLYRVDHELFGYSPRQYLNWAK